jgi:hypothetical protein
MVYALTFSNLWNRVWSLNFTLTLIRQEVHMRKYFLSVFLILLFLFITLQASAFTYEFYHVAVRDMNGDGVFNTNDGDKIRYGFTFSTPYPDTAGWQARAYDSVGNHLQTAGVVGGGTPYHESLNGADWAESNYWRANFTTNGIAMVDLYQNDGHPPTIVHNVNLPDISTSFASYNGFDPTTVSWEKQADGVQLSWEGITPASGSSYRLELANSDWSYSILQYLDGSESGLFLPNSLIGHVTDVWYLQFQERLENPNYPNTENFNWLRSYSEGIDCDFSATSTNAVPIPGSVLLLSSGIIGLIGFRRKRMS